MNKLFYNPMQLRLKDENLVSRVRELATHLGRPITVKEKKSEGEQIYKGALIMVEVTGFIEIFIEKKNGEDLESLEDAYYIVDLSDEDTQILTESK